MLYLVCSNCTLSEVSSSNVSTVQNVDIFLHLLTADKLRNMSQSSFTWSVKSDAHYEAATCRPEQSSQCVSTKTAVHSRLP